jgi:adenine-specific DNA methylase
MGYLHRMVTCPKCGRKIPWRETVSDDGTCRDCENRSETLEQGSSNGIQISQVRGPSD